MYPGRSGTEGARAPEICFMGADILVYRGDALNRILSVKEIDGKKYYKLYFIVDEDTYDMILDLMSVENRDFDEILAEALMQYYSRSLEFSKTEEELVKKRDEVKKDIGELKDMLKRLEKRIKEAISEVLSSAPTVAISTPRESSAISRRGGEIDVDMPDLEVVEEAKTSEESRVSLEEALAQAIVVAIDDELRSVMEEMEEKSEDS